MLAPGAKALIRSLKESSVPSGMDSSMPSKATTTRDNVEAVGASSTARYWPDPFPSMDQEPPRFVKTESLGENDSLSKRSSMAAPPKGSTRQEATIHRLTKANASDERLGRNCRIVPAMLSPVAVRLASQRMKRLYHYIIEPSFPRYLFAIPAKASLTPLEPYPRILTTPYQGTRQSLSRNTAYMARSLHIKNS